MENPPPFEIPPQPLARPRRRGCLGCLGCLPQVLGVLLLGYVFIMLITAVLAPYAFYYGGHFHLLGGWQGQGTIHNEHAGGDYFFYLNIEPSTPGYRKSDIKGIAYLCTPKGERFRLNVGGSLPRSRPTNTLGVPIHLYLFNRPLFVRLNNDHRPSLDLHGAFGDRQLVLEDSGSLPTAFRPDGTLYPPNSSRPWSKEQTTFTLYESSPWILHPPACPAKP